MIFLLFSTLIYSTYALDTPIIGILSQENFLLLKAFPDADSFIVASYVKFLESAGARVIPIWIGQDQNYYQRAVNYTNGILFPGGGTYFNESKGYGEAALQIYNLAKEKNNNGIYYPIFGICLGMQAIIFADNNGTDVREICSAKSVSLPLVLRSDALQSKIFKNLPKDLAQKLETENVTYHYHRYCLFEKALEENGLAENWKILSTNKDINDLEFISTMEHVKYPFYGVQYHPEKNLYEFKGSKILHTLDAIDFSQYLANFFVRESRKNGHNFPNLKVESKSLMYNYKAEPSYEKTSYEQVYLFTTEDYKNNLL